MCQLVQKYEDNPQYATYCFNNKSFEYDLKITAQNSNKQTTPTWVNLIIGEKYISWTDVERLKRISKDLDDEISNF